MKPVSRLWHEFKTLGSEQARSELITRHRHLAWITAKKHCGPLSAPLAFEDFVGAGMLGLIKAVDQFDPDRGLKFESYAITLIRGAILESLRDDDWMPRTLRDQQKALKATETAICVSSGRLPTEEEVAGALGISLPTLTKRRLALAQTVTSLNAPLQNDEGQAETIAYYVEAPDNVFEQVAGQERSVLLETAKARLPQREQAVVRLHHDEGLTFKAIGEQLCVSESRAYQLHNQALNRLRGYLEANREAML